MYMHNTGNIVVPVETDIKLVFSSNLYQASTHTKADISSAHTSLVLTILRYQDKYQSTYIPEFQSGGGPK
jgi:hypothetical protein